MSNPADKLIQARCRLLVIEPFYGAAALNMEWIPSEMLDAQFKTMGVCVTRRGIQCHYNPEWVSTLSVKQLYGGVQHEIEHVIRMHCQRLGNHNIVVWNLACDMVVNGKKSSPRIGFKDPVWVPVTENMLFIPPDWPENEPAEYFYNRLYKILQEKGGFSIGDDGTVKEGGGGGEDAIPVPFDDHNIWRQSDVSEDEARQLIKNWVETAAAQNPGNTPGHISELLKKLQKPIVHWQQYLHQYVGRHIGNKRWTYSRANRRREDFGLKGISHRACADVVVITDTSGSVTSRQFEMFFAEIDQIAQRTRVFVLQWDHTFQGWGRYRRGAWKNFKISGRGGTDMQEPVKYLEDNHLLANLQIMFTDGEVSAYPQERKYPFIFVIANERKVELPKWGHVIQI